MFSIFIYSAGIKDKLTPLINDLEKNNIEVIMIDSENDFIDKGLKRYSDEAVIISDDVSLLDKLKKYNICRLGALNWQMSPCDFNNVSLVFEGFDDVGYDYINKMYQRFHNIPWTILQTDRCIVREMTLDDLDALYELYDDDAYRYLEKLSDNRCEEREKLAAYIENMYKFYEFGLWAVIDKQTGKLIGRAGFNCDFSMGYLIKKEHRNKGIAYEVCNAMIQYANENIKIGEIWCRIDKNNIASVNLAKKLGFKKYNGCIYKLL